MQMSVRRRWLISVVLFITLAGLIQIVATALVAGYGAWVGGKGWLMNAAPSAVELVHASSVERLQRVAAALEQQDGLDAALAARDVTQVDQWLAPALFGHKDVKWFAVKDDVAFGSSAPCSLPDRKALAAVAGTAFARCGDAVV